MSISHWLALIGLALAMCFLLVLAICRIGAEADRDMRAIWRAREPESRNLPQSSEPPAKGKTGQKGLK